MANMVYIELEELKEILPDIFNEWMDGGDESWEWIFQEIEQKCHIGKRKKDKKWKKKLRDDVDELQYFRHNEYEVKVNGITTKVNELNDKVSKLNDICNAHTVRLDRFGQDIKAAKMMAQIARDRTQVDYSKYSGKSDGNINYNKEKSDADVIQEVYNRMAGRGATREELDSFRNLIQKYDALEKKEIRVCMRTCETCKYISALPFDSPCANCCYNGLNNNSGTDKWEAKDND